MAILRTAGDRRLAPAETILAIRFDNQAPVIDLNGGDEGTSVARDYDEGDPVLPIAPAATVVDPDSQNFENGVLTVSFGAGATEDDQLRVGGRFYRDEGSLFFAGNPDPEQPVIVIGFVTGGSGTSPLTITFTADATPALVEELLRSIGYVNRSLTLTDGNRTLNFVLTDGDGGTSNTAVATIAVTATDDPAVAADDFVTTPENLVLNGNVFVDNGSGADRDPDDPIQVTAVNGATLVDGQTITLPSGAKLTMRADGSFTYDPNGQFEDLPPSDSGAVNGSENDSFTYTINGESTATVTVAVTGEADAVNRIEGDGGDNGMTGTRFRDIFLLQTGGDDAASGLGGNDTFYFGGAFNSRDFVDGGADIDSIILQGDYSGGVTFGSRGVSNIVGIETISLAPGHFTDYGGTGEGFYSYVLNMLDSNVAPDGLLKVNGFHLRAGEGFTFNGGAELSGRFILLAGLGLDDLTGGGGNDIFVFGHDGRFASGDSAAGGGGYDVLYLRGDYSIDFNADGFAGAIGGIESITLGGFSDAQFTSGGDGEFDYSIVWADGLTDGGRMTVNGSGLGTEEWMRFDGSAESSTAFRLFGGAGVDDLRGGGGNDFIFGGARADTLYGNGGNDVFLYYSTTDSVPGGGDRIEDFRLGDLIDLSVIDADTTAPGDQAFTPIGAGDFTQQPGQLRLFGVGPLYIVQGDVNGDGAADFEITVVVADAHPLGAGDFIL